MASVEEFKRLWEGPEPYIEVHTSGSTGHPKTLRLLKADMRRSARATNAFFGIDAYSMLALPLSVDYIAGKMMVVRALEAGCTLTELPVSSHISLEGLPKITLLPIVPAQVSGILAGVRPSQVNNLLIGGAPLSFKDEQRLIEAGFKGYVSYGMTETCSHVALRQLGTIAYHAMPGIVFDTDERGALVIDGAQAGFSWQRLRTNDAVTLLSPTQMQWHGRLDWAINSGGIKLHPEQLERQLQPFLSHPFYIIGRPHPRWGQCVTLVTEAPATDNEAILALCRQHLAPYAVPRQVENVLTLPRTPSGKLLRR